MAAKFGPVGPNLAAIFSPGQNMAAIFGPRDKIWMRSFLPWHPQGSYGNKHQACSSRVLQLSNSAEILPRVASEREQEATSKNAIFYPIIRCSETIDNIPPPLKGRYIIYAETLRWSPLAQAGIDDRAPFLVAGYGRLHLPFSGITQYLRGLVSLYERPIIAGVRILIVSSILAI